jgi:hypothetical protein
MTFFRHMTLCERNGSLVNVIDTDQLPKSYTDQAPRTGARFALLAGELNKCFLAESQKRTFAYFENHAPGRHSLHVFPGYSHLDIFMGKNAARDIFPTILRELAGS